MKRTHSTRRFCFVAALSATFVCSCAHKTKIAAVPARPATAFDRQVVNAIDAGDGDYLMKSLREKLIAHPDELAPRLEIGKAYQQRGYPELAIEHYRLAADRFPDSAETQLLLAKALREQGRPAEAAASLDRFLKAHPQKSPRYDSWLGILRDELGQYKAAETAHRAALELAPDRDDLHNNLGYCLLKQGKKDAAADEFRAALKLQPDSKVARNNLGMALATTPKDAVLNWQSVSDPATAHNNMAALLIEQRKYSEARKELDIALSYNKSHPAALNNLKLVASLDGKPASSPSKPSTNRWARLRHAWSKAVNGKERNQPGAAPQAGT